MSESQTIISSPAEVVRVVVLGAGSSSSTPKMGCITSASPCSVCCDAQSPNSRNHRLNPSLLIQIRRPADAEKADELTSFAPSQSEPYSVHNVAVEGEDTEDDIKKGAAAAPPVHKDADEYLNIMIDCGKTFREASLRHFRTLGVQNLHALLITHDHADAAFGVDDLREFTGTQVRVPMPVYLDGNTDETMRRVFGYLYPKTSHGDGRWVAALDWIKFEQGTEIPVCARGMVNDKKRFPNPEDRPVVPTVNELTLPITSVPTEHGPNYYTNGFIFELSKGHVCVYYSDISRFDETDEARLKAVVGDRVIEVLVLDMLSTMPYFSHFSRDQSLQCAAKIKAKHTYFVGMSHTLEYGKTNAVVQAAMSKEGLHGELAYDGCVLFDRLNVPATKAE